MRESNNDRMELNGSLRGCGQLNTYCAKALPVAPSAPRSPDPPSSAKAMAGERCTSSTPAVGFGQRGWLTTAIHSLATAFNCLTLGGFKPPTSVGGFSMILLFWMA